MHAMSFAFSILKNDRDYGVKQDDSLPLNPLLRKKIEVACGRGVVVHCFSSLLAGIKHFGKNAGVRAKNLPTEKQATEIKKEIDQLLPVGWLSQSDDAWIIAAHDHRRKVAALLATIGSGAVEPPQCQPVAASDAPPTMTTGA
jgi:hypothetical protein